MAKTHKSGFPCATILFGFRVICTALFADNKHACGPWWHIFFNTGNVPIKICANVLIASSNHSRLHRNDLSRYFNVFLVFDTWVFAHARFQQCFSSPCFCRVLAGTKSASDREPGGSLIFDPNSLGLNSLPACFCHNYLQSNCTSWKDNRGCDLNHSCCGYLGPIRKFQHGVWKRGGAFSSFRNFNCH